MKKNSSCMVALALTSALSSGLIHASECDPGEKVVKFSHVTGGTTHPKVILVNEFAANVNREMNGKLCVEVYPNSTLFGDSKELEALLLGDVQLLAPSLAKFGAYTDKYAVFDLPFLFKDLDQIIRFTKTSEAKELLNVMEDSVGFVGLGYWMSGMKYFTANKPLMVPSDAEGLKIRVQSSTIAKEMIRAMGASPQVMAFSEVYGALQTGVVDGQENTWSNIYTKKFYEVQDSITETNHQVLAYLFVTSSEFLNSLSEEDRAQFLGLVDRATESANKLVKEKDAVNRENILRAGGKINTLTTEQRAEWVQTMSPIWEQFEPSIGKRLIETAAGA
ncbi:DctP family TRAP transporter solute-binding subunit [Marinomonas gallaica]|uniref:DctP family TRAP transporter solute-binding subunit n=1 Tax=Marinomonas gallaica TaxID=1806667 RepID=UPI003CE4CB51